MRVLFQNSRVDWMIHWGGDSTQMVETKQALEELGVTVELDDGKKEVDLEDFDLVHVFNIQTADTGVVLVEKAKQKGVPVVVSPIYWDLRDILKYTTMIFPYSKHPLGKILARIDWRLLYIVRKARSFMREQAVLRKARKMLEMADMILPNSYAELEILVYTFKYPWLRAKAMIVPNGVRPPGQAVEAESEECRVIRNLLKDIPEPYVLEVALIHPVKGQLSVVKALMDHPEIPLVFVGRGSNSTYGREVQRLAAKRGNVYFLGEVKHECLPPVYSNAKVHVLCSLRESPGLASLEAAVHGANLVVSIFGPVAEYFGQDVWYCDPLDVKSIERAILGAWQSPRREALKRRILENFTWRRAAEATLAAYKEVLSRASHREGRAE